MKLSVGLHFNPENETSTLEHNFMIGSMPELAGKRYLPCSSFLSAFGVSNLFLSGNLFVFLEFDIIKQQISVCELCQITAFFSLFVTFDFLFFSASSSE